MIQRPLIEWRTVALVLLSYASWLAATTFLAASVPVGSVILIALSVALHGSLSHEVIHGHPTRWQGLNAALVRPALCLVIPYGRFRDTHLEHHRDETLTDPYDDPETNFLDPAVWARLHPAVRGILIFNNSLSGRLLIGPAVAQITFMRSDLGRIASGDRAVLISWLAHSIAILPLLVWIRVAAELPVWAIFLGTYAGLSVLKIRTFLEHQAHHQARARTVVVEDRGPLAFLFLNNNFHVVHHMHPQVPWYRLPQLYQQRREHYLRRNDRYRYASYGQVFARYLLSPKDPVPHPLWPQVDPKPRPPGLPAGPLLHRPALQEQEN